MEKEGNGAAVVFETAVDVVAVVFLRLVRPSSNQARKISSLTSSGS